MATNKNPGPASTAQFNAAPVLVYKGYSTDTLPTVGVPPGAQFYFQDTGGALFWNAYTSTWSASSFNPASLPTTLPATSGVLWNDGGVVSIS
jgi:hypothetical protein